MAKTTFIADRLFDGDSWRAETALTVEDGRVVGFGAGGVETRLAGTLAPGFIDVQVNGGGGALFNAQPSAEAIARIGAAHARHGTTAFLPTLVSDSFDVMARAADAVGDALRAGVPGVLGVHFEGPHLALKKRGIHAAAWLRPLGDAELALFARDDIGVRVVTVAPEVVSPDQIHNLVALGVHVCLGHSAADLATVRRALAAGASGFTHLYNAMSAMTSREPGMVGAALADDDSWCGLILDGHHVHDASAKIAVAAKPGKIMWVTDAMSPLGSDENEFDFFGERVIRAGDALRTANGTLAGSMLDMTTAVRNGVRRLGLPLDASLKMASRHPAEFLRLGGGYGRLEPGGRADFVWLDEQLHCRGAWIGGSATWR